MLIHTKMQRPRLQQDSLQRPHLIERLNWGLDRKLTLISAQAGAGKTTLMAQWLGQCSQPNAWLSLDVHDNDLMSFANYVCAAIRTALPDACGQAHALLQTQHTPPSRILVTALVNELDTYLTQRQAMRGGCERNPGLIIALDDFHVITAPSILAFHD